MTKWFNDPEVRLVSFFVGMLLIVTSGLVEELLFRLVKSPSGRNWFSTLYPFFGLVPIYWTFIWPQPGIQVLLVTVIIVFFAILTVRTPRYCTKCGSSVYRGRGPPMGGVDRCPTCSAPVSRLSFKVRNHSPEPPHSAVH